MRGRAFLLVSGFLLIHWAFAQKLVKKEVLYPSTKYIQIDASKCFQLLLTTHQSDFVKVEASMEGEYAEDLIIKLEEDGNNISISSDFLPSFNVPNDKLSAHKVISIALNVTLPEYMMATVFGTYTNVTAKGVYNHLSISLADGNCILHVISEKTEVNTQTGEIRVVSAKGVVTAESIYGNILKGAILGGDENYLLKSVEGTIIVNNGNG